MKAISSFWKWSTKSGKALLSRELPSERSPTQKFVRLTLAACAKACFSYTAQTGLPYFDRAAVIAIGSWYYGSTLEPMRGHQSFLRHLVNIGLICTQ